MTHEEQEAAENLKQGLGFIDRARREQSYLGAASSGALTGVIIGYLAHFKDKGHRELGKHALAGAGFGIMVALLSGAALKGISSLGHRMEKDIETGRYRLVPGQMKTGWEPWEAWEPWERRHHHHRHHRRRDWEDWER